MNVNKALGSTIRELRKSQGLSQEKLAEKAGLHRTYIGALERGEKSPTIDTLTKVVLALNTCLSDFFIEFETKREDRDV